MTRAYTTSKKAKAYKRAKPKKALYPKCQASVDETAVIRQNIYPIEPYVEVKIRGENV